MGRRTGLGGTGNALHAQKESRLGGTKRLEGTSRKSLSQEFREMSSQENSQAAPSSQASFQDVSQKLTDLTDEVRQLTQAMSIIASTVSTAATAAGSPIAIAILERFVSFATGTFIPQGMAVDSIGAGALLNMTEDGAQSLLERNNVPSQKPGKRKLYRTEDLPLKFNEYE
jgi:hypothetical protein